MSLAKCPRCKNLFNKSTSIVCMNCAVAEEADYEKVKECLSEAADMAPEVISEKTGVSLECVLRMVEQDLLVSSSGAAGVKCGRCGAPAISASKKLCSQCLEDLNRQMSQQRAQLSQRKPPASEAKSVRQTLQSLNDKL